MTDGQWETVWRLVQGAEELPPEQWAGHLAAEGVDPQVAAEALRILRESEAMQPTVPVPQSIGPYRILRLIAEGGMGIVYEAEQAQPRRHVALKVIKPGHMTAALRRRFEWEAEALGRLSHPGIAQIFDAGTAETGFGAQSYFAMEYVEGRPLTEFAQLRQLDLRGRLTLLMRVCEAVQHAHSQGIIHRDLKPSNILVTEAGEPRILDFGVARLVDSDVRATRHTSAGELVGTLAYMSPEQVSGDPQAIDTRSDVYALGVILYELLAGRLPYQIQKHSIYEAARVIAEQEPAPLELKTENFRGDVETILLKALEKDKGRRYWSAAALAEDIGRYLHDEPIAARPATAVYKARKFAKRHRGLVAGMVAAILAMVGGTAVSVYQAIRATRAEQTALAVGNFLQNDLLAQASANVQASSNYRPDPDLKVRTVLDRAAQRIAGNFAGQPEVESAIRHTIGRTYLDLGLYKEATEQLAPAEQLRRQALGRRNPATLQAEFSLAELLWRQGKHQEARQKAAEVRDERSAVLGPKHPETLAAMHLFAGITHASGQYANAAQLFSEVVLRRREVLGAEHADTLQSMSEWANAYLYLDKSGEAQELAKQVLEARMRTLGPEHPDSIASKQLLALAYSRNGYNDQALPLYQQVWAWQQRVLGSAHPATLITLNNMANVLYEEGEFAQAEQHYAQCWNLRREKLGEENLNTLTCKNNLANALADQGKFKQAEQMHLENLAVKMRVEGAEHPETARSMLNLALTYGYQGRYAEAEGLYRKVIDLRARLLGARHPNTINGMFGLARILELAGRWQDAERQYREVLALRRQVLRANHPSTLEAQTSLATVLIAQRKFTEAEELLRAIATLPAAPRASWTDAWRESLLGMALAGEQRFGEAESHLQSGYQKLVEQKQRIPAHRLRDIDRARMALVAAQTAAKR